MSKADIDKDEMAREGSMWAGERPGYQRKTKKELIEMMGTMALKMKEYKLRCETAIEAEKAAIQETERLKETLGWEKKRIIEYEHSLSRARRMIDVALGVVWKR